MNNRNLDKSAGHSFRHYIENTQSKTQPKVRIISMAENRLGFNRLAFWFLSGLLMLAMVWTFGSCKNRTSGSSADMNMVKDVLKNDIDFKYFSSRGKLKYSGNGSSMTVTSQIRMKKSEIMWTRASLMGIEGMRAMVTRDSLTSVQRMSNSYVQESILFLEQSFGMNLDYDILEALIMGDVPLQNLEKVKITKEEGRIILREERQGYEVTYIVDRTMMRMTELNVNDKKGSELKAVYSDFEDLDKQKFATTVKIEVNQKGKDPIVVDLNHKKIKKTNEPLDFPINIPSNFTRTTFDK